MILSHEHRFVFIKTRKTGGTSLEIALSQYCGPKDIITEIGEADERERRALGFQGPQHFDLGPVRFWNHDPASKVRTVVGPKLWADYFTFTIERNPYDKAISQYWFVRRKDPAMTLSAFIASGHPHLSNWDTYADGDEPIVDHVIRYENLDAELKALEKRLGIGPLHMIRAKGAFREDRRHYRDVLSAADRAVIEQRCARELAYFGYAW